MCLDSNLRNTIEILFRSGMSLSSIRSLMRFSEDIDLRALIPDIAEVRARKGRGNSISVIFSDGSQRDLTFASERFVPEGAEQIITMPTKEFTDKIKFNSGAIWVDSFFYMTKSDIFEKGINVKDPFLENFKTRLANN